MISVHIPAEAKFVTGVEAIRSPCWPFGRDIFYKMVHEDRIIQPPPIQARALCIPSLK